MEERNRQGEHREVGRELGSGRQAGNPGDKSGKSGKSGLSTPKKNALGEAGGPGRTPGNAEGDRSDIEEWLQQDSEQERREEKEK